jgi:hypothetical protein
MSLVWERPLRKSQLELFVFELLFKILNALFAVRIATVGINVVLHSCAYINKAARDSINSRRHERYWTWKGG